MRLLEILTICGVLTIVDAAVFKRTRLANSARSDHTPPTLSLTADLQPINTTHVNVSITNSYLQQISILKWNNHFQTNQNAAHGSFQLTDRLSNGSIQRLGQGPDVGRFRFMEIMPSHFFNISAGATYTNSFDLTQLFNVPEPGTYNLTMDFISPVMFVPDGMIMSTTLANAERQKPLSQYLPRVRIKSNDVPVVLQASSPSRISRKRTVQQETCLSQPQSSALIYKARGHARSLAKFAQAVVLPPLGIGAHGVSTHHPKPRAISINVASSSMTTSSGSNTSRTTVQPKTLAVSTEQSLITA